MKVWNVAGLLLLLICCRDERQASPKTSAADSTVAERTANEPVRTPPVPSDRSGQPPAANHGREPVTCIAAAQRLCPVDEGTHDASFEAFRKELTEAVQQKNDARLLALLDPNIRTSFGNGGGAAAFAKRWKTSSPQSEVWAILRKILSLGGTFRGADNDASFWAPYVYSAWPEAIDAFQHVAAVRAHVEIRKSPGKDSDAMAVVDWAILELLPGTDTPKSGEWLHVKTPDGHEGWVHADDVHSPVGYRAGFSKRSGRWMMEALVAGD